MRLFSKYRIIYLVAVLFYCGCKQSFHPPAIVDTHHYLVVEGYINTGGGPSVFTLTRTRNLSDTGLVKNISGVPDSIFVTDATVRIQDQQGQAYPLSYTDKGVYVSDSLHLDTEDKYRLYIKTDDGKEYESEYVAVAGTPPLGDISWEVVPGDGLHIDVSVSGNDNNAKYMRWTYTETWEFHSYKHSAYIYDPVDSSLKLRTPEEMVDTCWQSDISRNINLSTSSDISQNIQKIDLVDIPYHDEKASILYSILIHQIGISKEEYQFWLNMKKNTESLGSIFDSQPFTATGNIHCLTDPKEPVIGYVGAEEVVSKRIFIDNSQLPPDWNSVWQDCGLYPVPKDSLWYYYGKGLYSPIDTVNGTERSCADCTTRGTTTRPSFWP